MDNPSRTVSGNKMTIRLAESDKRWLFNESDRTGKTVCSIIREAIDSYIKAHR